MRNVTVKFDRIERLPQIGYHIAYFLVTNNNPDSLYMEVKYDVVKQDTIRIMDDVLPWIELPPHQTAEKFLTFLASADSIKITSLIAEKD